MNIKKHLTSFHNLLLTWIFIILCQNLTLILLNNQDITNNFGGKLCEALNIQMYYYCNTTAWLIINLVITIINLVLSLFTTLINYQCIDYY